MNLTYLGWSSSCALAHKADIFWHEKVRHRDVSFQAGLAATLHFHSFLRGSSHRTVSVFILSIGFGSNCFLTWYGCWPHAQPSSFHILDLGPSNGGVTTKLGIYEVIIRPALTHGSECRATKANNERKIGTTCMVRGILVVSRREHTRNKEIPHLPTLQIAPIDEVMRCGRLRWFGHVQYEQRHQHSDGAWQHRVPDDEGVPRRYVTNILMATWWVRVLCVLSPIPEKVEDEDKADP